MAASNANILSINTASTSITTGAYVQLSVSTPIVTTKLHIVNNTSSIIKVGVGASGSEVGLLAVLASSQIMLQLDYLLPLGSRISLEALDATASSGYIAVSLIP